MVVKSDKELKKELMKKISASPEKYFELDILKKAGFSRGKCKKCGKYFWSIAKSKEQKDFLRVSNEIRDVCGDSNCCGGYTFFDRSMIKRKKLDYISVWKEFSKMFSKLGYVPIKRYPVAARWRKDTDFVQASIYDFQPYVVSGEVKPPANPLVVPQVCLRFNDIDNVGMTGAHFTGFVMIGQHAFVPKKEWNQKKYFSDIKKWLNDGLGLDDKDIIFHEDVWAGGGNFGACMEFFSGGLELGNQVYMLYEKSNSGLKELKLKVLDMGMGHERNAWFSKGTSTAYDAVFPTVMKKLYKISKIKLNHKLIKDFLPYASFLNIDEIEDAEKSWKYISNNVGVSVDKLKKEILPLAALYSIAEHSRALLFALCDGVLPSNAGGGYNLRVILRRALSFIDKYGWKLDVAEICKWHAEYLKPLFPELMKNLGGVKIILGVEKRKYYSTKQKGKNIIKNMIKKKIDADELIKLYDSHGIQPEMVKELALKIGEDIKIPSNFYAKVAMLHEAQQEKSDDSKTLKKLNLKGINETKILYYEDYRKVKFGAKVLKIIGKNVILDRTYFYPTSGGQLHDVGFIDGQKVVDVFKQDSVVVHVLKEKAKFKVGSKIVAEINFENRKQLTQHHTAVHIINAAARKVLGGHVFQAGAKKGLDKAHLDITHYDNLSDGQVKAIQTGANKIVSWDIPVDSLFLDKDVAEKRYGLSIYQGGVVPGNNLRIVKIGSKDIEACGGTHVNHTSEVGKIKIIKTSKIQDGIIRIEFSAGKSAMVRVKERKVVIDKLCKILGVSEFELPYRAEELFLKWKKARKIVKKGKKIDLKKLELVGVKKFKGDVILETCKLLNTQPQHLVNVVLKFDKQLKEFKDKIQKF